MATTGRKNKQVDKNKKKINGRSKARSKSKEEVCVISDIILTERLYCCDDECCCLY